MALTAPPVARGRLAPLRRRAALPLYRNGYALIAGSAVTSVLGLAFWVIAARAYTREAVGVGAALIAAMTLLANLSQLNLKSALNRFLPRAGDRAPRLVVRAYAFAAGLAAVAAGLFVAGLDLWAPDLAFMQGDPLLAVWFVVCTASWTIFVLQDSILAGIRQAGWVPAENGAYAAAKIGVLLAVTAAAPALGVFVAWSVPVLVLVVAVNVLLFARLLPRHARDGVGAEPLSRDAVRAYWAADATAYLVWAGTIGVLPLVVLGVAGAEATADFSIAWSIAYSLYLVSSALGMSLLTEGARDPARLARDARRTTREALALVAPAVALLLIGAPLLLSLLGDEYEHGAWLLRLLALSAVPYVVVAMAVTRARVERRMRTVLATYVTLCAVVLVAGVPLLAAIGVEGLGIAWLLGQTVVAAGLLVRDRRPPRLVAVPALSERVVAALGRLRLAARARLGWWSAQAATSVLLRRLAGDGEPWRLLRAFATDGDVAVAAVGPRGGWPSAIVKRARAPAGDHAVERQGEILASLHADPRLDGRRGALPRVLADGTLDGRRFVAESALPGRRPAPRDRAEADRLVAAATAALAPLQRATARTERADEEVVGACVLAPIAQVARVADPRHAETLGRLRAELSDELTRRRVRTCLAHGDLCPVNLLTGPGGEITGVVDWERASWRGSPDVDRMHLRATAIAGAERRELGNVVLELLAAGSRKPPGRGRLSDRVALLLAWLEHVAGHAGRSGRPGALWRRRNVDAVLDALALEYLGTTSSRPLAAGRIAARVARRAAAPAVLAAAVATGLLAAVAADPGAMTDGGLLTVLPPAFFAALAVLTGSFAVHVFSTPLRGRLLGAHVVALVALLHVTPVLAYGTLRYSWAWKHVGVVDFITRHDAVDRSSAYLSVYHNWPGFFGLDALATHLAGAPDAIGQAIWGPPVFQLLNVGALAFVLGGLTRDRRVVWGASWLMLVVNWVGQDYFSPQAFALFLYLVLLGVVVRWLDRPRRWALLLALALVAAIAVSHPLTGLMTVVSLSAAAVCGYGGLRLVFLAAAIVAAWDLTFASAYVLPNVASTIDTINLPWATTKSSLAHTGSLSSTQALVAASGRAVAVAIGALAVVGGIRMLRRRVRMRAAAAFAAAPLTLFAFGNYEGELLFRIYLFALPFLVFLAAHAFMGPLAAGRRALAGAAYGAASLALLSGFLVAYYGKENQYYFSPAEVAASRYVYEHAARGALLVEGTRSYPGQFLGYERLGYVTLSREPPDSQARVLAAPARVLSDWMTEPEWRGAYLIITSSMKAEVAEQGAMAPGSLDRIERALSRSRRFRTVVRNRDAVVFVPAARRSAR